MNHKNIVSTLLTILLTMPQIAAAHFHYEISVNANLTANTQQQLDAIQMTLTYNSEVSKLMLSDEKDLKILGGNLLLDLTELHFFTTLKLNNKMLDTKQVSTYKLEEIKLKTGNQLRLSFTLPLKKPVSLKGKNTLEIIHDDATGSAIIYYDTAAAISIDPKLNSKCKVDLKDKEEFIDGEAPQFLKVICHA